MMRFLRRLYYSGDTAAYWDMSKYDMQFWPEFFGFDPGTHPGIVADWLADRGEYEFERIVRNAVHWHNWLARRMGRVGV